MSEIITLSNGVRVIWEQMPGVRSASMGIWVGNGSRYEPENLSGVSHFIEHMLFKGTKNRSLKELSAELDRLGGETNAFTTKEATCYYGRFLDERLENAAEILADMYFESLFAPDAVELERSVIAEEISMTEDEPGDLCIEKLVRTCFAGSPLSRPILGTPDTLQNIDGEILRRYMREKYVGANTIVAIAGGVTQNSAERIARLFERMSASPAPEFEPASFNSGRISSEKATEQCHIALGFQGMKIADERRIALAVLNSALGGGVSSRLFARLRDELGLCYSVYSFTMQHTDTGMLGIYLGTGHKTREKALVETGRELKSIVRLCFSDEEVYRAREQLRAGLLMGLESTSSRQAHLGKNLLLRGYVPDPSELAAKCEQVSPKEVCELAGEIFGSGKFSLSCVGPRADAERDAALLEL